eukprot:XP_016661381.1 PREDICTED: uncharacterized protein LOC107884232 [Acyrthosiphon pisum]
MYPVSPPAIHRPATRDAPAAAASSTTRAASRPRPRPRIAINLSKHNAENKQNQLLLECLTIEEFNSRNQQPSGESIKSNKQTNLTDQLISASEEKNSEAKRRKINHNRRLQ